MKKIIFIGRSECGKTTLTQAMRGEPVHYNKTQYINCWDAVIDTPGEYAQVGHLARALGLYTYEADVVGLCCAATEPYCLFPPCSTSACNREVIGIVTKTDDPSGDPERAEAWLRLAGCRTVYRVCSENGEGVWRILNHLKEEGDVLPWEADAPEDNCI